MAYTAQTPRLWLERLTPELHLQDFHELWTDPVAVRWTTRAVQTSLAESRDWLPTILASPDNPSIDKFAILLRPVPANINAGVGDVVNSDGRPKMIGLVGTNRMSAQGMEVGYCLNMGYWGRGYATEGMRAFLDVYWTLVERKEFNSLVAKVHPENTASLNVLRKCGGREGEILRGVNPRFAVDGVKSDDHCWYFDRPGVEVAEQKETENGTWKI